MLSDAKHLSYSIEQASNLQSEILRFAQNDNCEIARKEHAKRPENCSGDARV
jgi:hypothetical protein